MSEHSTQFEAAGGGLVLRGAILLYRSEGPRNFSSHGPHRGDAAAFASMHAVEHDEEGRPTIAAGVPLSRAHLRQWTEALGRTVRPELLPENVLVAHPDMLAWWVPEQVPPPAPGQTQAPGLNCRCSRSAAMPRKVATPRRSHSSPVPPSRIHPGAP